MTTMTEEIITPALGVADLVAIPFGMITPKEVVALWPGWIARRHVTLVVAAGGTSKGLWTVDIMARVTTGRAWPGEPQDAVREPEAVILVAPEDDPNEAVAWRLKAAGADSDLVFNLTALPDGSPFILPDSVDSHLRPAVEQIEKLTGRKVGLIVIDPLMSTVEKSIASNIAARKVVGPLEKLARETGPAVILTHHTVKSGAVAGAKGLTDAMRHVLRIDRPAGADKDTPLRVVSVEKSNIATTASQLRYTLAGDGEDCHVYYPQDEKTPAVSRGYDIDATPLMSYSSVKATAAVSSPSSSPATSWQVLMCVQDSKPAKIADGFTSESDAKAAAVSHAGHPLPWMPGDNDSQYAGTVLKGGKQAAYTVFPNGAK